MKTKFKLWYFYRKNGINTVKFIFISSLLLIPVWFIDIRYPEIKVYFPQFLLLPTDLSKTFLSTLAGAFLTVATFTFTTILTVLWNYASNYTPRVMQKFIDKPHVLSLIGIFIGGFFYSVLSLFFLQGVDSDAVLLAGSVGVFYAIVSMAYFLLFVQQVLRDVKAVNLVQDIYTATLVLVQEEAKKRKSSERLKEEEIHTGIEIYAHTTGYLFGVDYERLFELIQDLEGELIIYKKIGEYVSRGIYIARLALKRKPLKDSEEQKEWLKNIGKCFLFSREKDDSYDYHYEITNLVEISLRAISPGINDPNTAINCIRKISNLLGKLFSTKNHFIVTKENRNMRVIYTTYTVKEELYLTFHQIINYGKDSPSVAYAILEGLLLIYMISDNSADEDIKEFFNYTYSIIEPCMVHSMDRERIRSLQETLSEQVDISADKEVLQGKK